MSLSSLSSDARWLLSLQVHRDVPVLSELNVAMYVARKYDVATPADVRGVVREAEAMRARQVELRRPAGWCQCAGDQLAAGNGVYFDDARGHGWNCASCGLLLQEG